MTLKAVPITLREARRWIGEHHRHNLPPRGCIVCVSIEEDGRRCAVGVLGRTVGRGLHDGETAEITRCCTDGTKHAASMVYGRLCRAASAVGFRRVVTYTLASEDGTSLRAAGFEIDAELPARAAWSPPAGQYRMQQDLFGNERRPPEAKVRWVRVLAG